MSWQVKDTTSEMNRLRNDLNKIRDQLFITQAQSGLPSGFLVGGATGQGSPLGGGNQVGLAAYQSTEVTITDLDVSGSPTGTFDRINLATSNMIIKTGGGSFDVKFLQGTLNDGQYVVLKPESGTTITLKTGGNMHLTGDVTVSDTEFVICIFYEEQTSPDSNGNYVCHKLTGGGGGGGMNTDLSNMTSPTVPTVDLNMNQHQVVGVTGIDMDGATATIVGVQLIDWFQGGQQIESLAQGLLHRVASGQSHEFEINLVNVARFADIGGGVLALEMFNHSIDDVKDINFDGGAVIPTNIYGIGKNTSGATDFMQYNVGAVGEFHRFEIVGNQRFLVDNNGVSIQGTGTMSDALQIQSGGGVSFVPGRFRQDGTDVFIFSGGSERNISNVGATAGADTDLANLIATSINQDLDPDVHATRDLGSAVLRWNQINGVSGVFNTMNISLVATFDSATLFFIDACFMSIDTVTGLKIGTGTTQKIGFWNSTPLVQQTVASDTLANLYTLLRAIGIVG